MKMRAHSNSAKDRREKKRREKSKRKLMSSMGDRNRMVTIKWPVVC